MTWYKEICWANHIFPWIIEKYKTWRAGDSLQWRAKLRQCLKEYLEVNMRERCVTMELCYIINKETSRKMTTCLIN